MTPANVLSLATDLEGVVSMLMSHSRKGLAPLFVIGAGMSTSAAVPRVPTLKEMLQKLGELLRKAAPIGAAASDPRFAELLELFDSYEATGSDDAVMVARILMDAQASPSQRIRGCWDGFSEWLLFDCLIEPRSPHVVDGARRGLLDAEPTPAHEALAELYERLNAVGMSLNFDGLTRKALWKAGFNRAMILDEPDSVETFYTRSILEPGGRKEQMVPVLKLRGDAFMAACQHDGCTLRGKTMALWTLLPPNDDDRNSTFLACAACRYPKQIGISFPGVVEKEVASQRMLASFHRSAAVTIGSVFVVGFSGRWDHVVAKSLVDLARVRTLPMYVIRRNPKDDRIFRGVISSMPLGGYFAATADEFMIALAASVRGRSTPAVGAPMIANHYDHNAFREEFWNTHLIPTAEAAPSELERQVISHPAFRRLGSIAQLGLKNHWLGIAPGKTESVHQRKAHSLGAMRVASLLYQALQRQNPRGTPGVAGRRDDGELYFLRLATLLHDIGHMPFSHMLEEVFEELSWTLESDTRNFRHTDYTEKLVREIFSDADLSRMLQDEYGYTPDDVIRLIHGAFGVHYLDALVNSAVDADKIDYVFRDSEVCEIPTPLSSPSEWLKGLLQCDDLAVSPEGFLKLGGSSAEMFLQLLRARMHLYETFYLSDAIRFPEALTRFLLVLCLTSEITPKRLKSVSAWGDVGFRPDLGQAKILSAQEYLVALGDDVLRAGDRDRSPAQYELAIVNRVIEQLLKTRFHRRIIEAIECIRDVVSQGGRQKMIEKHAEHSLGEPLVLPVATDLTEVRKLARDTMLRKPGAVVIDIVRPTSFLSSALHRRLPLLRGRGRVQDCVLVPQADPGFWKRGDSAVRPLSSALREVSQRMEVGPRVSIFRINSNENYARQARDHFLQALRGKGLL